MSLPRFVYRPSKVQTTLTTAASTCAGAITAVRAVARRDHAQRWTCSGDDTPKSRWENSAIRHWETAFINSLVAASTCRGCRRLRSTKQRPVAGQNYGVWQQKRSLSQTQSPNTTVSATKERRETRIAIPLHLFVGDTASLSVGARPRYSKEDYTYLVDTYGHSFQEDEKNTDQRTSIAPPTKTATHYPLASPIVYTPEQEEYVSGRKVLPPESEAHRKALSSFTAALRRRLGFVSLDALWDQYLRLQQPRLRYIDCESIKRFFRHLSWVEKKDAVAGERFLALLEECLGEKIKFRTSVWNTAISFVGKSARKPSTDQVRRAVELWMRMEQHGTKATAVTFNILFDVAVKAGRFALVDTIYRELQARNITPSRFLRTSIILYAGMRRNGDDVRKAFRDMVNGGEIIDTAVMNAVILSLLSAGEPSAAEHVFLKMKRLHDTKSGTQGPRDWRERKALTIELNKTAKRLRRERAELGATFFGSSRSTDDTREAIQENSPIAPDAWTYGILIRWHCESSNDLTKVRSLVAEMREANLVVNNAVYLALFRGFARHGGHAYTEWNRKSLEFFWTEFLAAASKKPSSTSETSNYTHRPGEEDATDHGTSSLEGSLETNVKSHDLPLPSLEVDTANDNGRSESLEIDLTSVTKHSEHYGVMPRETQPPHFTRALVAATIDAFWTCAGRPKMLEVWAVVQEQWIHMTPEDQLSIQKVVDRHVRADATFL